MKPSSAAALEADLLLLSGGVSMGKYDLVEEVLLSLGAEFFFTGALIQPGKPVVFGRLALGSIARFTSLDFLAILYPPWLRFRFLSSRCWARSAAKPAAVPVLRRLGWRVTSVCKTGLTRFLPAMLRTGSGRPHRCDRGAGRLARLRRPREHQPLQLLSCGSRRPRPS